MRTKSEASPSVVTLSVVMPAHNEGAHIESCVREWYEAVVAAIPGSELIVVDDCSTDDTGRRLERLSAKLPHLRVVKSPTNVGHGPAVRLGLDCARGEFVFQTDSDRQHAPEDFASLWDRREQADFLFGVRTSRADGVFRKAVSRSLKLVNFIVWGRWIADANCPFKLMRRSALEQVLPSVPKASFIPMVMVSVLAHRRGHTCVEVPVRHFARTAGQQSMRGLLKWVRVGSRCARELVALRFAEKGMLDVAVVHSAAVGSSQPEPHTGARP